jgi:hypothetical protein
MDEHPLQVRVECDEGYREEETPRRFFLRRRAVDIEEVLDRWLSPDHHYRSAKCYPYMPRRLAL